MRRAAGDSRATRPPTESFRERDARLAAEKVKAWTGGLCHDRKALGEERQPLPFERGYVNVKPGETIAMSPDPSLVHLFDAKTGKRISG